MPNNNNNNVLEKQLVISNLLCNYLAFTKGLLLFFFSVFRKYNSGFF